MKLQRYGLLAGVLAGSLALAACGSDNTDTSGSGGGTSANSADCASGTLQMQGSSAQGPAMTAWIQAYQTKCSGANVNYTKSASGTGRTAFINKQNSLVGSDSALKEQQKTDADKRCSPGTAVDLPMVITPIAIGFNVSGVTKLTLTPSLISQIFNGKITKWNDAAIAKANAGVTLPATTITTVHRSTDSGTTQNFTNFLVAQAKADWPYEAGQSWQAPGGQGAANSTQLAQVVKSTDGAIGYLDNTDAKKNSLAVVSIDTGSGGVDITTDSVSKAVEAAKSSATGQDIKLTIDYGLKAAGAYPAILATYEITCTSGLPSDQAKLIKSFLTYTASDAGQQEVTKAGHYPLPASLLTQVQQAVASLSAS